jgi:Flp pilus assembly protein TadG
MSLARLVATRIRRFAKAEEGGMTVLSLFLLMAMLVVIGIAIDTSRLQARTTMMQVTADSAAFAAAAKVIMSDATTATGVALQNAQANMPAEEYGNVLLAQDVEWGVWDKTLQVFRTGAIIGTTAPNAVRVTVRQTRANGNPFTNILLGWVGVRYAEPVRVSVATFQKNGDCLRGFLSQTVINIQSNNNFFDGFCLYGGALVDIQSNGFWENGTSVVSPSLSTIQYQSNNIGLDVAIKPGTMDLPEVTSLPGIIESLRSSASTSLWTPSYIPASRRSSPVTLTTSNLNAGQLTPGYIYIAPASVGCPLNISGVIREVVLITDCSVTFKKQGGTDPAWESSVLATTSRASDSIDGPESMLLGRAGGCAAGEGSNWLTLGSIKLPAKFTADGAQIMAAGNVNFTANATSATGEYKGLNIIAGGRIEGTSNMNMSPCGGTPWTGIIRMPVVRTVL